METISVLVEEVDLSEVVIEQDLIRNLKVLGKISKNNRQYPQAVQEKACTLFEGSPTYLNHSKDHTYQDKVGYLKNARVFQESTYADFVLNPMHPMSESIKWDIVNKTPRSGFSINAKGKLKDGIVESIDELISVDLVDNAATCKNFFEGVETEKNELKEEVDRQLVEMSELKTELEKLKEEVAELKKKRVVNNLPMPTINNNKPSHQDWLAQIKKDKTWDRV